MFISLWLLLEPDLQVFQHLHIALFLWCWKVLQIWEWSRLPGYPQQDPAYITLHRSCSHKKTISFWFLISHFRRHSHYCELSVCKNWKLRILTYHHSTILPLPPAYSPPQKSSFSFFLCRKRSQTSSSLTFQAFYLSHTTDWSESRCTFISLEEIYIK